MRPPIHTLPALVVLAFALLGSCGQRTDYPSLLLQADSAIIHADYQQADCLLARYDGTQGDASQHACMYRQFLRMERKFVDDSLTENDYALTDSLCRYYASNGDKEKEAVTLLMLGDLYRTAKDFSSSLEKYLEAEPIICSGNNLVLKGWLSQTKGDLFLRMRNLEDCIDNYHLFFCYACENKDTLRMAHAAQRMGLANIINNEADSAIYYYNLCKKLAQQSSLDEGFIKTSNLQLSDLYIQLEEYDKALPLMTYKPESDNNWAYYYLSQDQIDSAEYYFKKAITHCNYRDQQTLLRDLTDYERSHNRHSQAVRFYKMQQEVEDSIVAEEKRHNLKVAKMQHTINVMAQRQDILAKQKNRAQIITMTVALFLIGIVITTLTIRRNKSKKKELEMEEERLLCKEQEMQCRNNIENLEKNKMQIAKPEKERIKEEFITSPIYRRLRLHIDNGNALSEDEWKQLAEYINTTSPNFTSRLFALSKLSVTELRICYLVKLEVQPVIMADILCKSKSAISMARNRLYAKITGEKGTSKQFDEFILKF